MAHDLLTVHEVALHFHVNTSTIRNWIYNGKLPAVKIRVCLHTTYRIHRSDLPTTIPSDRRKGGHREYWKEVLQELHSRRNT